jgi:hypothetical protein
MPFNVVQAGVAFDSSGSLYREDFFLYLFN